MYRVNFDTILYPVIQYSIEQTPSETATTGDILSSNNTATRNVNSYTLQQLHHQQQQQPTNINSHAHSSSSSSSGVVMATSMSPPNTFIPSTGTSNTTTTGSPLNPPLPTRPTGYHTGKTGQTGLTSSTGPITPRVPRLNRGGTAAHTSERDTGGKFTRRDQDITTSDVNKTTTKPTDERYTNAVSVGAGQQKNTRVPIIPSSGGGKKVTKTMTSSISSSLPHKGSKAVPVPVPVPVQAPSRPPRDGGYTGTDAGDPLDYERMRYSVLCGESGGYNNADLELKEEEEDIGGEHIYEET